MVECDHDNELDTQELGEWSSAFELILSQTVENDQSIKGNTTQISAAFKAQGRGEEPQDEPDTDEVDDREVHFRKVEIESGRLAKDAEPFAYDACDRNNCRKTSQ